MSQQPASQSQRASFSRPGAVDLSHLAASSGAGPSSGDSGSVPAGRGSYVVQVTEQLLDPLLRESMQYPVILELTSPAAHGAAELSQVLVDLSDAARGQYLVGRVDIDAEPRIAQALGVTAVPTVVALIGGQMAPLFQGTRSRDEVQAYLDQVHQVAVANGITGTAAPGATSEATDDAGESAPAADPKYAAADDAMQQGDFATAVAEFDAILKQSPADSEAIAGRAQAALLQRSTTFDPAQVVQKAADASDIDAQLDAADLEVIQGEYEAAFDRLIGVVRDTSDADRERVRLRVLELFDVIGKTDPAVLKARRQLTSALF